MRCFKGKQLSNNFVIKNAELTDSNSGLTDAWMVTRLQYQKPDQMTAINATLEETMEFREKVNTGS